MRGISVLAGPPNPIGRSGSQVQGEGRSKPATDEKAQRKPKPARKAPRQSQDEEDNEDNLDSFDD